MDTFMRLAAFMRPFFPTRGCLGAGSNACWSISQRWSHTVQELPPLFSGTALNFTQRWGSSQPSIVFSAFPVGLALLRAKDRDQSLSQQNFTTGLMMKVWHLNCPLTGYKPTRHSKEKESDVHMRRDPGRLSEMEKIGLHFLLVLVRRQAAVFCGWWCRAPCCSIGCRTLQQLFHGWKIPTTDSRQIPQAPSCTSSRSSLVMGESSLS